MRIVSLLPSATEILFALGLDREVVGVTHECDFPPQARIRPVVIHSRIPHDATPAEIDRLVREYVSRGESLYGVQADLLESLRPDLIITQDLCHVCAASPDDLATALARFDRPPEVLCLNPQDLGDVWRDILWVGEETGRGPRAEVLVKEIGERLAAVEGKARSLPARTVPAWRSLNGCSPFTSAGIGCLRWSRAPVGWIFSGAVAHLLSESCSMKLCMPRRKYSWCHLAATMPHALPRNTSR